MISQVSPTSPLRFFLIALFWACACGCVSDLDFDEISPNCVTPNYDLPNRDIFCGAQVQLQETIPPATDQSIVTALDVKNDHTVFLRSVFNADNFRRSRMIVELVTNQSLRENPAAPEVVYSKNLELRDYAERDLTGLNLAEAFGGLSGATEFMNVSPWTNIKLLDEDTGLVLLDHIYGWHIAQLAGDDNNPNLNLIAGAYNQLSTDIQTTSPICTELGGDILLNFDSQSVIQDYPGSADGVSNDTLWVYTPTLGGLRLTVLKKDMDGIWSRATDVDQEFSELYETIQEDLCLEHELSLPFINDEDEVIIPEDEYMCFRPIYNLPAAVSSDRETRPVNDTCREELDECIASDLISAYVDCAGNRDGACLGCLVVGLCEICQGCLPDVSELPQECNLFCRQEEDRLPREVLAERRETCAPIVAYGSYTRCNNCTEVAEGEELADQECARFCSGLENIGAMEDIRELQGDCDTFFEECNQCEGELSDGCEELCEEEDWEVFCIDPRTPRHALVSPFCAEEYTLDEIYDDCQDDALVCECETRAEEIGSLFKEFVPTLSSAGQDTTSIAHFTPESGSGGMIYVASTQEIRMLSLNDLQPSNIRGRIENLTQTFGDEDIEVRAAILLDSMFASDTISNNSAALPVINTDPQLIAISMLAQDDSLFALLLDPRTLDNIQLDEDAAISQPVESQRLTFYLARYPIDSEGVITDIASWTSFDAPISGIPNGTRLKMLANGTLAVHITQTPLAFFGEVFRPNSQHDYRNLQTIDNRGQLFLFDTTNIRENARPFFETTTNRSFIWSGLGYIDNGENAQSGLLLQATEQGLEVYTIGVRGEANNAGPQRP